MIILDGFNTAKILNIQLQQQIAREKRPPQLDIILIGNNPASQSYVKSKLKSGERIGIKVTIHHLDEKVKSVAVERLISKLNQDQNVDGILLQLPLSKHLDEVKLMDLIDERKDVDGFHTINQGKLFQKRAGIRPATPQGIMMLLDAYHIDVAGKHVVVIGRSQIVGAPIAKMMLDQNATVTITHSKTINLEKITKQADIIVVAIGKANFLTAKMVKKGAVIIDVGINRVDGKIVGDVDFKGVSKKASYITPVPKGVGPMTICALSHNLYELYKEREL